jgi:hypothetical protein
MKKSFSCLTVSKRQGWQARAAEQVHAQTAQPKQWIIIQEGVNAPKKVRASNLNASLNAGLRQVKAEYVIFYQDFIDLPKDCFKKLLFLADEKTFVTTATINDDGSDDARYTGTDEVRRIRPEQWEANVSIAPMKVLKELGGFEEELDNGWSWDNVHLAQRAAMLGCKFLIDEGNRPQLLPHEQTSKLKLTINDRRCADSIARIRLGTDPIKCNYL